MERVPYVQTSYNNNLLLQSGSAREYMDQAEDLIGDSFERDERVAEKARKEKAAEDASE